MTKLVASLTLALCLAAGAAGVDVATGGATATRAHAADGIVVGFPPDVDFRCFLCDWYGCAVTNAGGSGCDESSHGSCQVVEWGCVEWPSGGFIDIRW